LQIELTVLAHLEIIWPWALMGLLTGLFLERLVLALPQWVLKPYGDQIHSDDWLGPGGGLQQAPRKPRQWTLALINSIGWACCAIYIQATHSASLAAVVAWALCASTLLVLAVVDWNTTLLPDILVLSLLWAGLLASERQWTLIPVSISLWSAAGWYAGPQLSAWLFEKSTGRMGMGQGDAKLLAAMAAWWGWEPVLWAMLIGSSLILLAAILWLKQGFRGDSQIPFGPALIAGICLWSLKTWSATH
jgi:leader peptidase (prepilin peptidase)/N-methyltransferase